ncbi:MAG: EAL domain-containing protein [Sphingomonadales bacterium]|nr:EAL domain-containing protein [Sphingomonadales bacterium]
MKQASVPGPAAAGLARNARAGRRSDWPGRAWRRASLVVRAMLREKWHSEAYVRAYGQHLSHRLPLIYCVVIFNALLLVWSFHRTAPPFLSVVLPTVLVFFTALRAWHWRPAAVRRRTSAMIVHDLQRLPQRCLMISSGFVAWALMLYSYGGDPEQDVIQYITAITCFAGILSLGQSPRTAVIMATAVMTPANIVFLMHDNPNRVVVVAVQTIITVLLLLITTAYHRDFVRLERSRLELSRHKHSIEDMAEAWRQRSIRDPLTGAWNRGRILVLLEKGLGAADGVRPWLALIDLDGFKHINDTFGHIAGDAVLTTIAERIARTPHIEACGRMGGDEFAVILRGGLDDARVHAELAMLAHAIARPIRLGDLSLNLHASIGYYRCQGQSISACLERADTALYKAKDLRNGAVVAFGEDDERTLLERQVMTRVFTTADLREQLAVVFQPIVDSDTGRPVSFEALVRWSPDGRRLLSPAAFISLAESTGRISEVTHVVLEKALNEFPAWQWGCTLSINLSAHDILRDDTAEWIGGLVRKAGAPPSAIILEITETALVRDYKRAAANLASLRAQGFRIALDDFGTGQSSLAHVHNLPLDHIKIDQSFARSLNSSENARAIIATIRALSVQLGLECTIEGIESVEEQVAARALGLRRMQGYLFGRPAAAVESRRLLAA